MNDDKTDLLKLTVHMMQSDCVKCIQFQRGFLLLIAQSDIVLNYGGYENEGKNQCN